MESSSDKNSHARVDGDRSNKLDSPQRMENITTEKDSSSKVPVPPPLGPVEKLLGYKTCEMAVFKVNMTGDKQSPMYTAENGMTNNGCTAEECNCDQQSVFKTIQLFCNALLNVAHYRRQMCPYTLEAALESKLFGVWFDWWELGELLTGLGGSEDNCSVNNEKVSTDTVSDKNTEECAVSQSAREDAGPLTPPTDEASTRPCTPLSPQSLLKQLFSSSSTASSQSEKQNKESSQSAMLILKPALLLKPRTVDQNKTATTSENKNDRISETEQETSSPAENTSPPDEPSRNNTSADLEVETESQAKQKSGSVITPTTEASTIESSNQAEKASVVNSIQQESLSSSNQEPVGPSVSLHNSVGTNDDQSQQATSSIQETEKSSNPIGELGESTNVTDQYASSDLEIEKSSTSLEKEKDFVVSSSNQVVLPTPQTCGSGAVLTTQKQKSTDLIPQQSIPTLSPKTPEIGSTTLSETNTTTGVVAAPPPVPSIPPSLSESTLLIDARSEATRSSNIVDTEKQGSELEPPNSMTSSQSSTNSTEETSLNSSLIPDSTTCASSSSNKQLLSSGTDSNSTIIQPPSTSKRILETIEGLSVYPNVVTSEGNIESQKSIFGAGDSARVRPRISRKMTEKEIEPDQSNPHGGEAMDVGETGESEDKSPGSEVDTGTPLVNSLSVEESDCNKLTETVRTASAESSTLQGKEVKPDSNVAGPAPASVKRQRITRSAKETAQAKISSTFGNGTTSETEQSHAKDEETTSTSASQKKRVRFSELAEESSCTTAEQKQVETVVALKDKNDKLDPDVNFPDSNPATLAVDESGEQLQTEETERSLSGSTQATETQNATEDNSTKAISTEENNNAHEATAAAQMDAVINLSSPSSESGEPNISEMPLSVCLEKRRKTTEKKERTAVGTEAETKRNKIQLPTLDYDSDSSSRHSAIAFKTRSKQLKRKLREARKTQATSVNSTTVSSALEAARAWMKKKVRGNDDVPLSSTTTKTSHAEDDDDDIQMIEERSTSMAPPAAGNIAGRSRKDGSSATKMEVVSTSNKVVQEDNIRITFNKEKTASILQRSNSSPVEDSATVENSSSNNLTSGSSNNINNHMKQSTSSPCTSSSSSVPIGLTAAAEEDVVLEDRPSFEFESGSSTSSTPQVSPANVSLNLNLSLDPTANSNLSLPTQSAMPSSSGSIQGRSVTFSTSLPSVKNSKAPSTPSSTVTRKQNEPATQDSLRSVRARTSVFDPKMDAVKISPKPVPTLRKELLQQQQSSSLPTTASKPKEKGINEQLSTGESTSSVVASSKEKTAPKGTVESSQQKAQSVQKSHRQPIEQNEKTANDDIVILGSTDNGRTGSSGSSESQNKQTQKSQLSDSQKDKSESEKQTTRGESTASVPQQPRLQKQVSSSTPQQTSSSRQNVFKSSQKPKPQSSNLVLIGGEIRAMPKSSANNGNSADDSSSCRASRNDSSTKSAAASNLSSSGGTWRRGSSEVRREPARRDEEVVDFETPPDDVNDRRSNNNNTGNRGGNRLMGRAGGFRGANRAHRGGYNPGGNSRSDHQGSPTTRDGSFFNGSPPRAGRSRGRGPRPPFRGGGRGSPIQGHPDHYAGHRFQQQTQAHRNMY